MTPPVRATSPLARRRRLAGLGLACALSFSVTAGWIHHRFPPSGPALLEVKLRHYALHADEIDLLFVGSSRFYRGISPEIFDRTAARHGVEVRSFNLATPGMRIAEQSFVLRRLAESASPTLRWVLAEFHADARLAPRNRRSPRVIFWHDPTTTWLAMRTVYGGLRAESAFPVGKTGELYNHLVPFLYRQLNVARLQDLLQRGRWPRLGPPVREGDFGPAADGYIPLELEDADAVRPRRREFLENRDAYRRHIESWAGRSGDTRNRFAPRLVRILERQVETLGARPVFVLMPGYDPEPWPAAELGSSPPPVLDFNDPVGYPSLFVPESRFDEHHLTRRAARRFSRMLAERFVELEAAAP